MLGGYNLIKILLKPCQMAAQIYNLAELFLMPLTGISRAMNFIG